MLSKEQLREIRAALTWGDQHYGQQQAKETEGATTLTQHAMHRRAQKMGFVVEGIGFDDFLDSVILVELGEVLLEERDPTSPSTTD